MMKPAIGKAAATPSLEVPRTDRGVATTLSLILLFLLACWLRVRHLGQLAYVGDEGLEALAVRGILETGRPLLPSGEFYLRAPLLLYLQAALAHLLDLSPFSLRLPSAVAGAAVVVPTYVLGRQLFNRTVGLMAASILALSSWALELARYGRPYTLFQLFFLLAVISFDRGFLRDSRRARFAFLFFSLLSFTTTHLGLDLVSLFLVPIALREVAPVKGLRLLTWFLALFVGFRLLNRILTALLTGPLLSLAASDIGQPWVTASILDGLSRILPGPPIVPPDLSLFHQTLADSPLVVLALTGLAAAATLGVLWNEKRLVDIRDLPRQLLTTAVIWCSCFHQFLLAVVAAFVYILLYWDHRRRPFDRSLAISIAYGSISFVVWVHAARIGALGGYKQLVLMLFGFPDVVHTFADWFIRGWPIMSIVLVIAVGALTARFVRDRSDAGSLLLLVAGLAPVLINGSLRSYYELRYSFHVYPLLVVMFCWFLAAIADSGSRLISGSGLRGSRLASLGLVILSLFVSQDANPLGALAIGDRTYLTRKDQARGVLNWRLYSSFHQDHEGPSVWVREHRAPQDIVIAFGPVYATTNYAFFVDRVDYAVTPDDEPGYYAAARSGAPRHYATGSRLITGLDGIDRVIEECDSVAWILADRQLLDSENQFYGEEVKSFLRHLLAGPAHTGRDGQTFAAEVPCTPSPP